MNDITYHGETLSFLELLKRNRIEIPIIQRDYAQGRIENSSIRQTFLFTLKESIEKRNKIRLDFIYGNIIEKTDIFQPLDGQQRLTTLFLLHWYAAAKSGEINRPDVSDLLLRFTYETRISSRDFCNSLCKHSICITTVDDKLSEKIQDSSWFFISWKQDPTIDSMLNTINDIHKYFFHIENLWELLTSKNLVTFHNLILKNFGLSDDLYIKMNARGKLLTLYENFKAELLKLIADNGWENNYSLTETFAYKIDTIWTDFFWANFRQNSSIDNAHMRFINALILNRIALDKSIEDRFQIIQSLNENKTDKSLLLRFTKEFYEYIYLCYEIYSHINKNIIDLRLELVMWRHQPRHSILDEIVSGGEGTYTHKVLFYAQTEYLIRNSVFIKESFTEWMRVVRNIVSRGSIDKDGKRPDIIRSPDTFHGVINLINEIAEGCSDIYTFLCNCNLKSAFTKEQIDEEKRKAKLICEMPHLKELIWKIEDNDLLRGRITFVFDCIGFNNDTCLNIELLSKIQIVFEKYFNDESKKLSSEFRRAMLTIEVEGAYEFYNYWESFWNVGNAIKRKLFVQFRELEYYLDCEQKEYFKKLVLMLIDKDYQQIIDQFQPPISMPNWKIKLIKEEKWLKLSCPSNYIAISEDNKCCYLLKSKRPRDIDGAIEVI